MQSDNWRSAYLVREALKNVFDARSRLFALLLLAVLAGSGGAVYAAWEANTFHATLISDARAGRNTLEISTATPNVAVRISRSSCERISATPGILRAGLLQPGAQLNYPQIGADIPTFEASSTLFPELRDTDIVVGSNLKHATHPFNIAAAKGTALRAVVASPQPEGIDTDSSVVVGLSPSLRYGAICDVVMSPYADSARTQSLITASLVVEGGAIQARTAWAGGADPVGTYLNRPGRFLPLLLGVFGGIAAAILNRLRTSEFAAYRLSGTSSRSLALIVGLEQLAIASVLAASALLSAALFSSYEVDGPSTGLFLISGALAWFAIGLLASIDVTLRRPGRLANDR